MFWYHMEGEDVGQLTVSLQHPEVPRSSRAPQNWTRSGDQGPHWRHARVTADSPEAPYQVRMSTQTPPIVFLYRGGSSSGSKSGSGNWKVAGSIPGLRLLAKCRGVPEQDTT